MTRLRLPLHLLLVLVLLMARLVAAESDTYGHEFWLAWPETTDVSSEDPDFEPEAEIVILTDSATPVPVTVTGAGLAFAGTTAAGAPATVRVPVGLKITSDGVVEAKGIRVASDGCSPVVALFRVPGSGSSIADDAYTALPVAALGTEYYPDTYHGRAEFVVLAVEDGTTVTWDNPWCPGPTEVTLKRGQTIQHKCPIDSAALETKGIVGTFIASNKPVAVYAGSAGSNIINIYNTVPLPNQIIWCCTDILLEQMRPVDDWETELRTVPFWSPSGTWPGDYLRVVAACDATEVSSDDGQTVQTRTLAAGESWDLTTVAPPFGIGLTKLPLTIRATAPIQVSQYMVGWQVAGLGDPSQTLVPGLKRSARKHVVYFPADYQNHLSLVVAAADTAAVTIDGVPVPSPWQAYADGDYAWTRVDGLAAGEHVVAAPSPVAATVYGYSLYPDGTYQAGSYAYPAPTIAGGEPSPARIDAGSPCARSCVGACQTLAVDGVWTSAAWSNGATGPSILYCPQSPVETVSVELEDAAGCAATGRRELLSYPAPTADAGPDHEICVAAPLILGASPTGSGGTGAYTYAWTPPDDLDDPSAANPVCTPTASRTYTVTVTDALGCSASDELSVVFAIPATPGNLGNSVRAVKQGDDVAFVWASDALATEYRLKRDDDKKQQALVLVATEPVPATTLLLAVPDPPKLAFYRAFAANCANVEGP